jgi:hypothetical protein
MPITTLAALPASGTLDAAVQSYDGAQYAAINAFVAAVNANNAQFATTPVNSAGLDPTTVQYATVNLTLTQLLALYTTPISLVAAPGAGKLLEFLSAVVEFVYGSAAFTIGSATNLTVKYTNASGAAASATLAVTGLFDQTATTLSTLLPAAAIGVTNAALVLSLAVANMTAGTGGSAIVKIAYRVHSGL